MTASSRHTMFVKTMTREEIDVRLEWALEQDGYNVGRHDAEALHAADPDGFLGLDIDGSLEGCIAALRYSPDFAFIGMYIVRDAVTLGAAKERLGVVRLLQAGLKRVDGACVGLEAVGAKEEQYIRWGKFRPVWRTSRQQLDLRGSDDAAAIARVAPGAPHEPVDISLRPAAAAPFAALAAYDAAHFGARREAFLHKWITLRGHDAWVCVDGSAEEIRGFGVVRPGHVGWQIGPLFADDGEIAEALLRQLIRGLGAGSVFLDTPSVNAEALALAGRYGMREWCATTRMYRDGEPDLPAGELFGLTTGEVG